MNIVQEIPSSKYMLSNTKNGRGMNPMVLIKFFK